VSNIILILIGVGVFLGGITWLVIEARKELRKMEEKNVDRFK